MTRTARHILLPLAALALSALSGCAQFDLRRAIPWDDLDTLKPRQPARVTAVWTDTVLARAGQPTERGFGGRVFFYSTEGDKTICVEGELTVYAFEEIESRGRSDVPDRRFVFTSEQIAKHYSRSALGHSYSFWLPWDEANGERKRISLLIKFQPVEGSMVVSQMTEHILPGRTPPEVMQAQAQQVAASGASSGVQLAAATEPVAAGQRMQTTTIALPPGANLSQLTARPLAPVVDAAALPGAAVAPAGAIPAGAIPMPPAATSAAPATAAPANDPLALWTQYQQQGWEAYRQALQAQPQVQPASRLEPGQFRVQGGPIVRPRGGHAPSRPHPTGWPSALPAEPQAVPAPVDPGFAPAGR